MKYPVICVAAILLLAGCGSGDEGAESELEPFKRGPRYYQHADEVSGFVEEEMQPSDGSLPEEEIPGPYENESTQPPAGSNQPSLTDYDDDEGDQTIYDSDRYLPVEEAPQRSIFNSSDTANGYF